MWLVYVLIGVGLYLVLGFVVATDPKFNFLWEERENKDGDGKRH